MAIKLIDNVPPHKLGYVIAYLQGICADEALDDAFCERLCSDYESDPERGQLTSMAEMAEMCGVDFNAL